MFFETLENNFKKLEKRLETRKSVLTWSENKHSWLRSCRSLRRRSQLRSWPRRWLRRWLRSKLRIWLCWLCFRFRGLPPGNYAGGDHQRIHSRLRANSWVRFGCAMSSFFLDSHLAERIVPLQICRLLQWLLHFTLHHHHASDASDQLGHVPMMLNFCCCSLPLAL